MNPSFNSSTDFMEENGNGNDSDTNSDDTPEYYQPISADDGGGDQNSDDDHTREFHQLPNGYCLNHAANGISSLDLNDGMDLNCSSEDEEDEEEGRIIEASESAIRRAFSEDENRRNAPLSAETAVRVMEAMRGVSFGGTVPAWAAQFPEDSWIDQLRRLRQTQNTSTSLQN